jgi:MerR family transcriptional regulator/heat shock protein HspR
MSVPGSDTQGSAFDQHAAVFVISVAAQLAGMHPQTLRQYDRLGLVSPGRTPGRGRRYSARDIDQLREVQRLSQEEGVNLAGIKRILELENQVDALRSRLDELESEVRERRRPAPPPAHRRLFSAGAAGEIVTRPLGRGFSNGGAMVVWRPDTGR